MSELDSTHWSPRLCVPTSLPLTSRPSFPLRPPPTQLGGGGLRLQFWGLLPEGESVRYMESGFKTLFKEKPPTHAHTRAHAHARAHSGGLVCACAGSGAGSQAFAVGPGPRSGTTAVSRQ